jgi:hypothetical protein
LVIRRRWIKYAGLFDKKSHAAKKLSEDKVLLFYSMNEM